MEAVGQGRSWELPAGHSPYDCSFASPLGAVRRPRAPSPVPAGLRPPGGGSRSHSAGSILQYCGSWLFRRQNRLDFWGQKPMLQQQLMRCTRAVLCLSSA